MTELETPPAVGAESGYRPAVALVSTRQSEQPRHADRAVRADLIAGGLSLGLVAAATTAGIVAGTRLAGDPPFSHAPATFGEWPILGQWLPHLGPGTPLALLIAVAAVAWGPTLAARLPWHRALIAGYLLAVSWTFALAMVDGWHRGITTRLTTRDEYISAVPAITDIPLMLRTFTDRILDFQPDSWITHVAGHPPGATLIFVWLDRVGLGGGAWAAIACVLVGAAAAVAVPVTINALAGPDLARAAIPFVALLPGAVWLGASADALFTGITATGVALLAMRRPVAAVGGGVLLGFGIFLSYGLVLMAPIALAVVWVLRAWRALLWAIGGALAVVAAFALAGFWWFDGYHLVVERYFQGIATDRPYTYWVWANLACLALATGPAAAAGLRRALPGLGRPVSTLVLAAAFAVLVATVSGLSKAEVERIWLPFAVWLVAGAALLPESSRRAWLAAGAATALVVNHAFLTQW
jgi:methylthioxylose transferase